MLNFKLTKTTTTILYKGGIVLISLLSLLPIFSNAIRYSFPIGYAGMYGQMAEQIANENFQLPLSIEFFGSGSVPAAFPPLGMYLLALYIKIGGPLWIYFRFVPAILSALALYPLFLIVMRVTTSRLVALITVFLASASPYLYASHTWAAGIVRALAYTFGLFFFYFFIRSTTQPYSKRESIIAAVLLSLTVLTHLSYAFFFVLWSFVWVIVRLRKDVLINAFLTAILGALISIPWVIIISGRFGLDVFLNALGSHGTLSVTMLSGNISGFFDLIFISLSEIVKQPVLACLALLGLFFVMMQKRWFLLLTFFLSLLFTFESRRFIIIFGCVFSAIAIESISVWITKLPLIGRKRLFSILFAAILETLIVGVIYLDGMQTILSQTPSVSSPFLETATYLRTNSAKNSKYLFLADHNEAEWFPFFTKRNQLFAFWGSEWSGDRHNLSTGFYGSMTCAHNADYDCLNKLIQNSENSPQYIVVMKKKYRQFIDVLKKRSDLKLTLNNSEYQIWELITQ